MPDINEIKYFINKMKKLKVLVIGETIIDVYQYGTTLGKVGKFPIVAFKNEKSEEFQGGVLAIKNHLNDFCNVEVYTDETQIVKTRYIEENQKIFETYDERYVHHGYKGDKPKPNFDNYDIVMVADFGHGFLQKKMIEDIEKKSRYLAINTQFNAGNMGMNTINKYKTPNYICIDHNELRLATSNQWNPIAEIMLHRFINIDASVTISNEGSYVIVDNEIVHSKPLAKKIVDTVGAGDAYYALSTLCHYLKGSPEVIGTFGNAAGAIACSYPGNQGSVDKDRLIEVIKNGHNL